MHRSPRGLLILAALSFAIACILDSHQLAAQPYRGYRPRDSVFRITGTNVSTWEAARELRLDYIRHYQAWTTEDWGNVVRRSSGTPVQLVESHLYRTMYDTALDLSRPVKLITPVYGVGLNLKTVRCFENFAKEDHSDSNCNGDALQALLHKDLRVIESAVTYCRERPRALRYFGSTC